VTAVAALWHFDRDRDARDSCARMLSALQPYGVHHKGSWADGPIALGRTLYRTLPEDRHDRQPLQVAGGSAVLVADLRLDNRDDLIAALGLGGSAGIMADSDILARAWEAWGEACVQRLIGDFAFVIWDARRETLFAARDPLGQRPLFYHHARGFAAVASMPKGLLALEEIPRAINREMLGAFIAKLSVSGADNPFGGDSFYQGVQRLPAGCTLTITQGGARVERYWSADDIPEVRRARDSDYLDEARSLFDQAVAARLRSDGGIGAHLSSGLDSGSVVAAAARLLGERGQGLTAFTAVPREGEGFAFRDGRFADEGPLAAQVAAQFSNVEHVRVPYPMVSLLEPMARALAAGDEPVRNPCNLAWIEAIGREARARNLRVMLEAPLGNATISHGGYERLHALVRGGRFLRWIGDLAGIIGRPRAMAQLRLSLVWTLPPRLREQVLLLDGRGRVPITVRSPLSPAAAAEFDEGIAARLGDWKKARDRQDSRAKIIAFADSGTIRAATLAQHGFELRDPTADVRLVRFCLGLPLDQFHRDGQGRSLVRRMMRGSLPDAVLDKHSKGLQAVGWLRNMHEDRAALLEEVRAMRRNAMGAELLDLDQLEALAQSIPDGAPTGLDQVHAYRHRLLQGASAARFIRFVEGANS
jgi:asparagine synthase (glutamine-hydrolysing)